MRSEGMSRRGEGGKWRRLALMCAAICCMGLIGASSALAKEIGAKEAKVVAKKFVNCPLSQSRYCVYAETLAGEFKIGSKTTTIEHPQYLQGGISTLGEFNNSDVPLIPPLWGAEELSKAAQNIPGGLTGVSEVIGGPVTATAELAQGHSVVLNEQNLIDPQPGAGVKLPIKVHLQNEQLGENCYIGSDENPIMLELTDHTTSPPSGTEPISGEMGTIVPMDRGAILELQGNKIVDNSFAAPAATGCGTNALLEPVITAAVNLGAGLPSPAGKNVAILEGNTYLAEKAFIAKADKKEIKAKEKAALPPKASRK